MKTKLFFILSFFPVSVFALSFNSLNIFQLPNDSNTGNQKINLLFTGDIFLDRHIDEKTQIDNKTNPDKYSYPFSGLKTLDRQNYDAWIGNLECPVTDKQSTYKQKEIELRFSCKKEYLPNLAKYFDIVSLANNHTDNMGGHSSIEETRKHLDDAGIKYFGDFDSSQTAQICKIVFIDNKNIKFPIALCGFHGVYALPTDKQLSIIKYYSKYFITFIMPHQGVEYAFKSNTYQKAIYRKMIDDGADAVIGSHPHVIEEVEQYKGKLIFYSLGNFIFDQSWASTREYMQVAVEINLPSYANNYKELDCSILSSLDCLKKADDLNITKPDFDLKFKPIFSNAGMDFITKLETLTDKQYQSKLKSIGFDKVASSSKIQ